MSLTATARVGHHRPDPADTRDATGRRQIADPVSADYNPLHPATRLRLNPSRWQDPDVALPAPVDELTGRIDPADVLALAAEPVEPPASRDEVLAELRGDLTHPDDTQGAEQ
ncbi:hypothetical protein [Micromonospora sp. NPDC050200]|uniref:hypothetical protein n=1 Tax=Micromonospora sp. NPDC050200 TaxID=3155664 RepID=UPI0033CE0474